MIKREEAGERERERKRERKRYNICRNVMRI